MHWQPAAANPFQRPPRRLAQLRHLLQLPRWLRRLPPPQQAVCLEQNSSKRSNLAPLSRSSPTGLDQNPTDRISTRANDPERSPPTQPPSLAPPVPRLEPLQASPRQQWTSVHQQGSPSRPLRPPAHARTASAHSF